MMNFLDETDDTNHQQGTSLHQHPYSQLTDTTNEPMQNYDGSEMRDSNSNLVYKSQFLSTHPLWSDCKERVGYGGKKFTYVSGDGVIRTMNAIFGHGAFCLCCLLLVILCGYVIFYLYLMCTWNCSMLTQ